MELIGFDGTIQDQWMLLLQVFYRDGGNGRRRFQLAAMKQGLSCLWSVLGLQLVHPSPGLWSIYHTIDSEVPTPIEAWQMTRFVDEELPHLPLNGPNVPPGTFTIPSYRWMPYSWSVNNVVMAEVTHTALACWQADRPTLAFALFKGALLDSMFLGKCPGNVGMCTEFVAYRH